ncbi:hypothetical protein [Micromonospora sp. NBRC 107095]|uniref:hypothetical protein n=1 Tax=Micromonospora sp. NBRC 107095 TaxID=3032209 RepID=UPI0024A4A6CE|nr:hypothetical protein [Micromonospora sp. NBRC 107095]GLZ62872.1 hypothetical protein Misp05_64480 [Micromonospora sp. NBRC 107095]
MADQLATPADLAALLHIDEADLHVPAATLLIECATAVVQEVAGQRIVRAESTVTLEPSLGCWLWLPQLPVVSVESVTLDGTALVAGADYSVRGYRLWRSAGWQTAASWETAGVRAPSEITVEYTHGYEADAQELQRARQAVVALAGAVYGNPTGVTREQVDDYAVVYEAMAARMEAAPYLRDGLLRYYGRSAGLITLGG